jgi:hypothetical protein
MQRKSRNILYLTFIPKNLLKPDKFFAGYISQDYLISLKINGNRYSFPSKALIAAIMVNTKSITPNIASATKPIKMSVNNPLTKK